MRDSELTALEYQVIMSFRHMWDNLIEKPTHWTYVAEGVDQRVLGALTDKNKVCCYWKDGKLVVAKG